MYLGLLHFITMDENIFTVIRNTEAVVLHRASGRQWQILSSVILFFILQVSVRMKVSDLFALQKGP